MSKIARPCACRGFIEADPKDPNDIERAVREHQRVLQHRSYVARAQLEGWFVAPQDLALIKPKVRRVLS